MVTMAMATKTGGSANDGNRNHSNGRLRSRCCCHRRGCFCCWVLSTTVCHLDPMDPNSYSPTHLLSQSKTRSSMLEVTVIWNDPSSFSVVSQGMSFICSCVVLWIPQNEPTPWHVHDCAVFIRHLVTSKSTPTNRSTTTDHSTTALDKTGLMWNYLSMSLMKTTIKTAVGMDSNHHRGNNGNGTIEEPAAAVCANMSTPTSTLGTGGHYIRTVYHRRCRPMTV